MIPIKIAGKKYIIKSINELTTKEFIDMNKLQVTDTVKYVAWQTNTSMDNSFFAVSSKILDKAIGAVPDITKLPRPKMYDYNKKIITVGQRHQVEASGLSGHKLLVFCLAVSQAQSTNIDHVNALYDEYMLKPFYEILPAGFFFFMTYKTGSKRGVMLLKWRQELTKILSLKKVRVLKG